MQNSKNFYSKTKPVRLISIHIKKVYSILLPVVLSLATLSAFFQVLNPSCVLSLSTVMRHVFLQRPLLRLPSGTHVSAKHNMNGPILFIMIKHNSKYHWLTKSVVHTMAFTIFSKIITVPPVSPLLEIFEITASFN